MNKVKELISAAKPEGISDYCSLAAVLEHEISDRDIRGVKSIRVAVLSSSTIRGVRETLFVKCCASGIVPDIYVADYNLYAQEILNSDSGLYKFQPDVVIVFIDSRALLGDHYLLPYQLSNERRKELVTEKQDEIGAYIRALKTRSSAVVLVHNMEVPQYSPLGILENKQSFGYRKLFQKLNSELEDTFRGDNRVFVFDYDLFCSRIGKMRILNPKLYYLADIKLDLQYIPALCDEYIAYLSPLLSLSKKCIVLDLDNVLWGGVVGEDGMEGIKLGPTPAGRPFLEFQQCLLALFNRGVILAINSKNNPDDARSVFQRHPHMVLKENNFAAVRMNWDDKAANMRSLAKELKIGLDSMVFFDDDKLNREIVKHELPEVYVVEMHDDPAQYVNDLFAVNQFNTLTITEEDLGKGRMYAEQRQRSESAQSATDITEYLKGLDMVVTIEEANSFTIPRIAQLTQKTNQFNMTTRRYYEQDIKTFLENGNYKVISIHVKDKFGDNGLTGLAIVKIGGTAWIIDTFLLSCRVIGRRVEEVLLSHIVEEAKKSSARTLTGEYIPTPKNSVAKDFYKINGFRLSDTSKEGERWDFDLKNYIKVPEFLKTVRRAS